MKSTRNKLPPTIDAEWHREWPNTQSISVQPLKDEAFAEYVGWIDLMGAKGWMAGSIRHAAELVGLIHLAAMRATRGIEANVYPVIDGVYIVSRDKASFRQSTHATMRILARTFEERKNIDRFLVRGGIAYGRVLHGGSIGALHDDLQIDDRYARCIAIGAAIRQAYEAEAKAPPFGFYVDMTARSVASGFDSPYVSGYDRWWLAKEKGQRAIALRFGKLVDEHFQYLVTKHQEIEYPLDRLAVHRAAAAEYFRIHADRGET